MVDRLIEIKLSFSQLKSLSSMLSASDLEDKEKLLKIFQGEIEEEEKRIKIVKKIQTILSEISGFDEDSIKESHTLKFHLQLSSDQIISLKKPFINLLINQGDDSSVSTSEMKKCKTVEDCIGLLIAKLE